MTTAMTSTPGSAPGPVGLLSASSVARRTSPLVTIDVVLVVVIAAILGAVVGSVLAGPLAGAASAVAAAIAFRLVLQTINT